MSEIPKVQVRRFSRGKYGDGETASEPPPTARAVPEDEPPTIDISDDDEDDDFLADLKNPVEQIVAEPQSAPTPVNTPEPPPPPQKKLYESDRPFTDHHLLSGVMPEAKPKRGGGKKHNVGGFGDIFGSSPTPILGADRRQLLTRFSEYKALFSDIPEIKSFKVKANASDAEIEKAITEMDAIVSCGTVQQMTDEMILSAVRVVEGVSSRTQSMDITGTADMLRANPEFHKLARLLTIKYRIFANVPPEWQMALLVLSTAMVARQKNMRSAEVASMLNRPI